jgi:phenylacetate-CoA ligase
VLVGFPGIAPHYQFVVSQDGPMATLRVEVEAAPDAPADAAARTARAAEVQHHIKALIGVTCDVAVMEVGQVPRSEGKAVRVRDLRK